MYYSCDLAVLQMVALLMNHLMLTDEDTRSALVEEMIDLCKYVEGHCEDVNISNSAVVFQVNLELMQGNATEVIAKLKNRKDPFHIMGGADVLLIQAYQMAGKMEESKEWNQVVIYREVLCLVQESLTYLMNHMQDKECAKATIKRITAIMEAYELKTLHPNTYLQFVYAKAMYDVMWENESLALSELEEFVTVAIEFLTGDVTLKGDAYFDKLDGYFSKMEEYMVVPRNPQKVLSTLARELRHPVFAPLFEYPEYQKLLERLK